MPAVNDTPSSKAFPIPGIIPIFPLPNVVLFPDTYLPLHIFEPRYREMVADASREGSCIGMALFKQGKLVATPQDKDAVTYAPLLKKEDGEIDWTHSSVSIERRIRAFYPWPSSYTWLGNKRLKILAARLSAVEASAAPGTIIARQDKLLTVATGQGSLTLNTVQLEGKKAMPIAAFLAGHALKPGDRLGRR